MPPSPFDNFIRGLEEAAEELLTDLNKQARQNLRDFAKSAGKATKPFPRAKGRAARGRVEGKGHVPATAPSKLLPTAYDYLEVSRFASQETISAAFRSLSTKYHPDKKTGDQEKYKDITAAWAVLKDKKSREKYDTVMGFK